MVRHSGATLRRVGRVALSFTASVGLLLLWAMINRSWASAENVIWGEPERISDMDVEAASGSIDDWFPELEVDSIGQVHIVWSHTTHLDQGGDSEQLFYTMWDGESWSKPNDILGPTREIIRSAAAVDRDDTVQLAYRYRIYGLGSVGIYYSHAPSEQAWSAAAWSSGRLVSARGSSYTADLAIDSDGVFHLVFDDTGQEESETCPFCADIFYRRSTDSGRTWSPPKNLAPTPLGASREQIKIGSNGTIHVTWDEGWDRLTGRGQENFSAYSFSTDGGLTWQPPITVSYPISGTAQLAVGADNDKGVMLVWRHRLSDYSGIYYQWSRDQGETWSQPAVIPSIYSRPWSAPFDIYDMATDSAGYIHLIVVGRLTLDQGAPVGVYHLAWDGTSWSAPEQIFLRQDIPAYPEWAVLSPTWPAITVRQKGYYPEYPRITVSHGNQLHVVWFTRLEDAGTGGNEVWYSRGQSQAPYQAPMPTLTPMATAMSGPIDEKETVPDLEIATPVQFPGVNQFPEGIRTEYDELLTLAIAISPIVLIGAVIWLRKRYR